MNWLGLGLLASIAIHAAILLAASSIRASASVKAPTIVKMKAVEPPKPPPPPPPPPPEPEAPKVEAPPLPKAPPRPAPKQKEIEAKPRPPEPESPPPPSPPPPPQGFSIDMSNTVQGGAGPAAPAVEGGGNMFADPNEKGLEPGKKTEQRTTPPSGHGTDPRGTAPSAPEAIEEPVPLGTDQERTPPYPQEARDAEVEGQVILRVLVDATGKVAQVKLQKSLGYGCDQAAMTHAKTWRFKPGTIGGRPVDRWITVPITFVLER